MARMSEQEYQECRERLAKAAAGPEPGSPEWAALTDDGRRRVTDAQCRLSQFETAWRRTRRLLGD